MLRNMATSIVLFEEIRTTKAKANAVKPIVEKLIVDTKQLALPLAIRKLKAYIKDDNAVKKLTEDLAKRYKDRSSGFTRIIPIGYRAGDSASMVQIELV
jgi:large subunit ribosomal protein L17